MLVTNKNLLDDANKRCYAVGAFNINNMDPFNIRFLKKYPPEDFVLVTQKEMVDKSGQFGVPVTIIDDQIVVGFDKGKLSEILGIK